jgi:hypothetical protein
MNARYTVLVLVAMAAFGMPGGAVAQEATEQFIPIGESPGVSREESYLGECVAYDAEDRVLQMHGNRGIRRILITEKTRIWLDRSPIEETNVVGDPGDLLPGRRMEVRYADPDDKEVADWVKVEIVE